MIIASYKYIYGRRSHRNDIYMMVSYASPLRALTQGLGWHHFPPTPSSSRCLYVAVPIFTGNWAAATKSEIPSNPHTSIANLYIRLVLPIVASAVWYGRWIRSNHFPFHLIRITQYTISESPVSRLGMRVCVHTKWRWKMFARVFVCVRTGKPMIITFIWLNPYKQRYWCDEQRASTRFCTM